MKTKTNGHDSAIQSPQAEEQATHCEGSENGEVELTTPQPAKDISERKIIANRKNSRKSTGPRTATGKKNVSRNAIKHGLLCRDLVIKDDDSDESPAEFDELLTAIIEDCQPEGFLEEMRVGQIAACYWRNRRGLRYEKGVMAKALASRRQRLRFPELEHFGLSAPDSPEMNAIVDDLALPPQQQLDRLVRYATMITKELNHAVSELERLQRRRKGEAVPSPISVDVSGN